MLNVPKDMSGGGFLLSKKMLCKSIKLPIPEQGCAVRVTSLGAGGPGTPRGAKVSLYSTELCIKP